MAQQTRKAPAIEDQGKAAGSEKAEVQYCDMPEMVPRLLPADIDPRRERLLRVNDKKWVNGTRLKYYFFDRPTDGPNGSWVGAAAQKDVVRRAFRAWKDLGIGLVFDEVSDREDAEIRIGFMAGDGSWSYVGRDIVDYATDPNQRTMNFGWDLRTDYGWDTALHEIGHTLGGPHEHQNPYAGIIWDEDAVYDYFSGPPNNWDRSTIERNILRKRAASEVWGSEWDVDSIMHYQFPAGLIRQPTQYVSQPLVPKPGLSERDIEWVQKFYPPLEEEEDEPELRSFESHRLMIGPGEQLNFRVRPRYTRDYTIQTFGESDTVMVLFEMIDGEPWYVDGDDDGGTDTNARMRLRLYRGREYVLRIRLFFSRMTGETAVMMW